MASETGAERYFRERRQDVGYEATYQRARRRIEDVDRIVRVIDERRIALGLTKAELARRMGARPEAVRRLLSARHANPTLATVVALAHELGLDVTAVPSDLRAERVTSSRSSASGARRRSA
ncbi:MAG: helix-turn-helix domain-containing protein [Acidimicrobiales bacterium]